MAKLTYLRAKLTDGELVVGEFHKLGNIQRYVGQVLRKEKPFNGWRIIGRVHPVSGEAVLMRQRRMYSGDVVEFVEQVVPVANATPAQVEALDPTAFEPAAECQRGDAGLWTAPAENTPTDAVVGTTYPVHRDAATLNRYVVLLAGIEGEREEVRFWLDNTEGEVNLGPADADEAHEAIEEGGEDDGF